MASAWPVWNDATVQLMAGFYERLGQNEDADLAESLLASAQAVRSGGTAQFPANRLVERRAPFWSWLRGRSSDPSAPKATRRGRAGYRLTVMLDATDASQLLVDQDTIAGSPEPDPDTAPSNWNHPYFWAGFAIHGTKDTISV